MPIRKTVRMRMRNGIRHLCTDGCMWPDAVILNVKVWQDLFVAMCLAREAMIKMGLPANEAPALHIAVWPRLVGRTGDHAIGPVIALETILDIIANVRGPNGETVDGIDIMCSADIAHDASEVDFNAFCEDLKRRGLVVGDIVAATWPNKEAGTGGCAFSDDEASRKGWLLAVEQAKILRTRLRKAGVLNYGRIRVDSSGSPSDFAKDEVNNFARLVTTFQAACDIVSSFDAAAGDTLEDVTAIVAEGEISWGGMNGYRAWNKLDEAVNRPSHLYFQYDLAHAMLFAGAYNVDPADSLLPPNVVLHVPTAAEYGENQKIRQATADERNMALMLLGKELGPSTGSFHATGTRAGVKGGGGHDMTGEHWFVGHPQDLSNNSAAAVFTLLEAI